MPRVLLEFKVDAQADDRAHTVKDCRLLLVGYAPGRVADVQDALEHTPVTAEAVEHPEDAVSILRQEDVDVVLLSCQYRAPEMLRPLVRQMHEAAGKPIFVFCMQAGQREEVLDIISACGLDGFVPRSSSSRISAFSGLSSAQSSRIPFSTDVPSAFPILFVFCMQAGQREEVLDIISACGLDGFVPLPFFLSNLG